MTAALRTTTGIGSYDRAEWSEWMPELTHVSRGDGLGSLYQHVPPAATAISITEVPPVPSVTLLFWTRGQNIEVGFNSSRRTIINAPWDCTVLPPDCPSSWLSTRTSADHVFHIHVDADLLRHTADEEERTASVPLREKVRDPMLVGTAQWIFAELDAGSRPSQLLWSTAGTAFAMRLLRLGEAHEQTRRRGGLAPWQQRRATEYLADHLAESISLRQLADTTGLSPFHFARMFRQSTGLPPHAYQRRLRCERARELLASTELSVGEISAAVGYDTPQAFARMFRAATGASPTRHRREQRS